MEAQEAGDLDIPPIVTTIRDMQQKSLHYHTDKYQG